MQVSINPPSTQPRVFVQRMDTVGDGSGAESQNVDGSGTEVVFRIKPNAGDIIHIARIIIYIEDNSSFDSGGWGALGGTPLTNGCVLKRYQGGTTFVGNDLKSNGLLAAIMYDVNHENFGSGNEFLVGRFTFTKLGASIRLDGDESDELQFVVRDNLTGLVAQYVTCEGWFENKEYYY